MKTAVVTAGSRGIGFGVVRMLVARGYRVVASYGHDDEAARRAVQELGAQLTFVRADHSCRADTHRFADEVKRLVEGVDCLVCNAGCTVRRPFDQMADDEWDAMLETALSGHAILLRELLPLLRPRARVLFTGSVLAHHPHATVVGYGVAKAAVHALVANLVKVLEPLQATVNAVAPGFVETDWHRTKPDAVRESICRKTAIHRFASVDEVAQAFAFCLDNDFVNGSIIDINGGYSYQ